MIVTTVLGAVARVHERLGLKATVNFLRGVPDDRLTRARLVDKPGWGALAAESEVWVTQTLQRCVTAGWVDFLSGDYALLRLTDAGRGVLAGKRPARIVLPPRVSAAPSRKNRRGRASAPGVARSRSAAQAAEAEAGWDEALFQLLREWRRAQSQAEGKPAFVVAGDRTLQDIATIKPTTIDDLKLCFGIGAQKAERYGEAIVAVVKRSGR